MPSSNPQVEYDSTRHVVRITCLLVGLLSNACLLFFVGHKLYKKQKAWNSILGTAVVYVTGTIVAMLYNLLYRWIIPNVEACKVSDMLEEFIISIIRSVLLMFYVFMLGKAFKDKIPGIYIKGAFAFIGVVHMMLSETVSVFLV